MRGNRNRQAATPPKGLALFWVLLFFEVHFLLNDLIFDRKK